MTNVTSGVAISVELDSGANGTTNVGRVVSIARAVSSQLPSDLEIPVSYGIVVADLSVCNEGGMLYIGSEGTGPIF